MSPSIILSPDNDPVFKRCLRFVLAREGGYVNDPLDVGGPTNFGVTQGTYDWWRRLKKLPKADVKTITREEAMNLYQQLYWVPTGCSELSWPVVLVQFDTAVLCGTGRANSWLKRSKGDIPAYLELRRQHHKNRVKERADQIRFLNGWLNRVELLRKEVEKA